MNSGGRHHETTTRSAKEPGGHSAEDSFCAELHNDAYQLLRSEQLQQYEIGERLGRGGQGAVFAAREKTSGELVAIKCMRIGATAAERIDQLRNLPHDDHITAILNVYGPVEGEIAVVMPRADYSLAKHVQDRTWSDNKEPIEKLLNIMRQAAAGLDAYLANGWVHRDTKPANLLIGFDGRVVVADPDLAKQLTNSGSSHSVNAETRLPVGSLFYLPDESWRGEVNPTIDQFGLARTYCELRTGSVHGNVSGVHEQMVLGKALSRNVADRYKSCAEFVEALADALLEAECDSVTQTLMHCGLRPHPDFIKRKFPATLRAKLIVDDVIEDVRSEDFGGIDSEQIDPEFRDGVDKLLPQWVLEQREINMSPQIKKRRGQWLQERDGEGYDEKCLVRFVNRPSEDAEISPIVMANKPYRPDLFPSDWITCDAALLARRRSVSFS